MRPEVLLDAIHRQQARVAGEVLEVREDTWAIHGVIPVDGDVILAEFAAPDEARTVLERLGMVEACEGGSA